MLTLFSEAPLVVVWFSTDRKLAERKEKERKEKEEKGKVCFFFFLPLCRDLISNSSLCLEMPKQHSAVGLFSDWLVIVAVGIKVG